MVIKNTVVKIQDCCLGCNGRLEGMCKSCGKHLHELQNICLMNCSSPDNPEGVDFGFHEDCGVSISSGEFELP